MTNTEFLRAHALAWVDAGPAPAPLPQLEQLKQTEWSPEFEQLQRNRLVLGCFRHGLLAEPGKPQFDRVKAIVDRAESYQRSGNTEWLVDIANLALLEFVEGTHPNKHFRALDTEQTQHVERKR